MRISDWSSDVCSSDLHVDRLEPQLAQAPVGDVADVALDLLGRHAGDGALFEGEVDERILEPHRFLAGVDDVFLHRLGQAAPFLGEGVEQLDDAFAVEAFVADRPADDLAHALHLVEAREVHQHRERSEAHTSELTSLMRISYAVFCLKKKIQKRSQHNNDTHRKTANA